MQNFNIRPINLIRALSSALELTVNGMTSHHLKTAIICQYLADEMRISDLERQWLLYAALLHDIGAAADWHERGEISRVDLRLGEGIFRHAMEGADLLAMSPKLADLADTVRYHHDSWEGGNLSGLSLDKIPVEARILHVADRVDVLLKKNIFVFTQKPAVLSAIKAKAGTDFDPAVVDAFFRSSARESFWLDVSNDMSHECFFRQLDIYGSDRYSLDDAMGIAEIFATIVDKTSSFTARHSRGVAGVAAFLANEIGFSSNEVKCIRIAGLLHDLGKLAIDNAILEKPGRLTDDEFAVIRQHTYFTYRVLEQIDGFGVIAKWAAYHHETLDGCGYPFRIMASEFPLGSRIVAVADVFTALTEERPYRNTLQAEKVKAIMADMAENKKLDKLIVNTLFSNYEKARELVS